VALCRAAGLAVNADELLLLEVGTLNGNTLHDLGYALAVHASDAVLSGSLQDLVPSIANLYGTSVNREQVPTRLWNLLRRSVGVGWREVGRMPLLDFMDLRGAGGGSLHSLVAVAIQTSLSQLTLGASPADPATPVDPSGPMLEAIRLLAAWGGTERGLSSLIEVLSLARQVYDDGSDALPADVRTAVEIIENQDLVRLGGELADQFDIRAAWERVCSSAGPRAIRVLDVRDWAFGSRISLRVLGRELGLSAEGIRQAAKSATESVYRAIRRPENLILRRRAQEIARKLGAACPVAVVTNLLAIEPIDLPPANWESFARFLLWLAGPYEVASEWLVRTPARELQTRVKAAARGVLKSGVAPRDEVLRVLQNSGLQPEWCERWLMSDDDFRVRSGQVVDWSGTLADKAELILRIQGEPMTRDELVTEVGVSPEARTLDNYLLDRGRFRRVAPRVFGLAEWEGEEYTTVVEEMIRAIEANGGSMDIDSLATQLQRKYGISVNSVETYAASWKFVSEARSVRVRRKEDSITSGTRDVAEGTRCYRVHDGWALKIRINSETLRGSGFMLPIPLARYLGIEPGDERSFDSDLGAVTVYWHAAQPACSSVSSACRALGAQVGDLLFIVFCDSPNASRFELVELRVYEAASRDERLALEIAGNVRVAPERRLATAIGFPEDEPTSRAAILERLRRRRELDLAALLPPDSHRAVDLDDFAAMMESIPVFRDDEAD
jgi:hypothetical protein